MGPRNLDGSGGRSVTTGAVEQLDQGTGTALGADGSRGLDRGMSTAAGCVAVVNDACEEAGAVGGGACGAWTAECFHGAFGVLNSRVVYDPARCIVRVK